MTDKEYLLLDNKTNNEIISYRPLAAKCITVALVGKIVPPSVLSQLDKTDIYFSMFLESRIQFW